MHGGAFDLLPREGGGTLARVTLPRGDAEAFRTRAPWRARQARQASTNRYCACGTCRCSSTTASAAMPSSRPVKPRRSVVVALIETRDGSQPRSAATLARIAGDVRRELRRLRDDRRVDVADVPARDRPPRHTCAQQRAAVGALPARDRCRESARRDRPARARRAARRRSRAAARRHPSGRRARADARSSRRRGRADVPPPARARRSRCRSASRMRVSSAGLPREDGRGERQVLGERDLEVRGAPAHEPRRRARAPRPPAPRRCIRARRRVRTRAAARRSETSAASAPATGPLRGTVATAPRRIGVAVAALQRVGDRHREQPADRDRRADARRSRASASTRHAGPRGVVHEHPVVAAAFGRRAPAARCESSPRASRRRTAAPRRRPAALPCGRSARSSGASATNIASGARPRRECAPACARAPGRPASGAYCFGTAAPKRAPPPAAAISAKWRGIAFACSEEPCEALFVERPETQAFVEPPRTFVGAMAAAVDARHAFRAQMLRQRRRASAPPTPRPCQSSAMVTSSSFATSVPRDVEIARHTTHAPTALGPGLTSASASANASQTNPISGRARNRSSARSSAAAPPSP